MAEVSFYDYQKEHPDADIKIAALTDDASHVCIPMRKGAETETLRAAIQRGNCRVIRRGCFDRAFQ